MIAPHLLLWSDNNPDIICKPAPLMRKTNTDHSIASEKAEKGSLPLLMMWRTRLPCTVDIIDDVDSRMR